MSKTVMLIHGAWLTPASRQGFRKRYEAKGYKVVAPPWPLEDVPIEELQRGAHGARWWAAEGGGSNNSVLVRGQTALV